MDRVRFREDRNTGHVARPMACAVAGRCARVALPAWCTLGSERQRSAHAAPARPGVLDIGHRLPVKLILDRPAGPRFFRPSLTLFPFCCRRPVAHAPGRSSRTSCTLIHRARARSRFLLHVLPSGFHRIRHYGLLANPRGLSDTYPQVGAHRYLAACAGRCPTTLNTSSSSRREGAVAR